MSPSNFGRGKVFNFPGCDCGIEFTFSGNFASHVSYDSFPSKKVVAVTRVVDNSSANDHHFSCAASSSSSSGASSNAT
ncbi:hypothetical protein T4B_8732 [Trichinella pseudospiralis]|uniref:Uncharacterized protein n=1 Tax=Trichinella pseudospiralis TaxID=6337 RepID=A0A0V1HSI1_TRIPS|nr:hypothetical protein T4B_8732 [Trichinella pseudospiralis]KRZ32100.1 hypothetical protein T4C_9987 [Trichinella pseudospiralis]